MRASLQECRQALSRALPLVAISLFISWSLLALMPLSVGAQAAQPTPAPTPCNSQACVTAAVNQAIGTSPGAGKSVDALGWWDPTPQIEQVSGNWLPTAQGMATTLFTTLFVIELFMVGLQTILFRDNLGEFFGSFAFKVFVAGFFLWVISNAVQIIAVIPGSFHQASNQISGTSTDTLKAFYGEVVDVVVLFITAAAASVAGSAAAESICPVITNCAAAIQTATYPLTLICTVMALLMFASLLVVSFTYIMLTIETAIVMVGGVFMLGFAGTRFTAPLSQGYLRYAFNVGFKLFAFWLIIAIEEPLMRGVLANAGLTAATALVGVIGGAIAGAAFPALGGGIAITAAIFAILWAAMGAMRVIILNALASSAPTLAASLLNGSTLFNAQETLKGVAASFVEAGLTVGMLAAQMNKAVQTFGSESTSTKLIAAQGAAYDAEPGKYEAKRKEAAILKALDKRGERAKKELGLPPVATPFSTSATTPSVAPEFGSHGVAPAPPVAAPPAGNVADGSPPTLNSAVQVRVPASAVPPSSSTRVPPRTAIPSASIAPTGAPLAEPLIAQQLREMMYDQRRMAVEQEWSADRNDKRDAYALSGLDLAELKGLKLTKFAKLYSETEKSSMPPHVREWIQEDPVRRKLALLLDREERFKIADKSNMNIKSLTFLGALEVSTHGGRDSSAPSLGGPDIK